MKLWHIRAIQISCGSVSSVMLGLFAIGLVGCGRSVQSPTQKIASAARHLEPNTSGQSGSAQSSLESALLGKSWWSHSVAPGTLPLSWRFQEDGILRGSSLVKCSYSLNGNSIVLSGCHDVGSSSFNASTVQLLITSLATSVWTLRPRNTSQPATIEVQRPGVGRPTQLLPHFP